MKKIFYILITMIFLSGCVSEEFKGTAIAFYPTTAIETTEQDGKKYTIKLQTTDKINVGKVQIKFDNYQFIRTVPGHNKGVIGLELTATREASFTVEALNDNLFKDYVSKFVITSVSGDIKAKTNSTFSFKVKNIDFKTAEEQAIPFHEKFDTEGSLGKFVQFSAKGNNQIWEDTKFGRDRTRGAKMTGYDAGKRYENEDWLISPPFDLTKVSKAFVEFYSNGNYSGPLLEVLVSTDYKGEGNPTKFKWVKLEGAKLDEDLKSFAKWAYSGKVNLSKYKSKHTFIAFKYTSTNSEAATWEIDDFKITTN